VLYVGKAKNLKKRIKSYTRYPQLSAKIQQLVKKAKIIRTQVLKSELQALLIEAELIRAHQPFYNSLLKDDKSRLYLFFTKEDYPKLLRLRKTDLKKKQYQKPLAILGPFASAYKVDELLKIVRPIFPWCNKKNKKENKACLYYHLELCPGACCNKIDPQSYQDNIKQLILFLRGQNRDLTKQLTKEMKSLAKAENFEEAQKIKNKIDLINEITKERYRLKPDLILPNLTKKNQEEGLIHLRQIMHQQGIVDLKYRFRRIEAYDVSNTQGQQATVSMVCFIDGQPESSEYKFFKIRQQTTPNDYAMLQEALLRRQKHPEWGRPDLIVIDGGKGQLRSAQRVWQQDSHFFNCPLVSVVKNPDRLILLRQEKKEKPHNKWQSIEVGLPNNHPALHLVIRLRDEAHRFAKKQHTRLREKNLLQ
jgi:excinuclease ABC subunit C